MAGKTGWGGIVGVVYSPASDELVDLGYFD